MRVLPEHSQCIVIGIRQVDNQVPVRVHIIAPHGDGVAGDVYKRQVPECLTFWKKRPRPAAGGAGNHKTECKADCWESGKYTCLLYTSAVRLAARLVAMGMEQLRWYLIGYGDEMSLRRESAACGMREHVVILGKKANPYPYMAACGLYVQPSRYEGRACLLYTSAVRTGRK